MNVDWLEGVRASCRKAQEESDRAHYQRYKHLKKPPPPPRPHCSPCRRDFTDAERATWPTRAVCSQGVCVPAGP